MYEKYPDLILIHIDAHADLREHYEGEPLSHSTPVRKAAGIMGGKNIYQFGIRSGSREEFQYGRENINFYPFEVAAPLKEALPSMGNRPVYVTIDIDVLDPSAAPAPVRQKPAASRRKSAGSRTSDCKLRRERCWSRSRGSGADLRSDRADPDRGAKLIREMPLGFVK